MKRYLLDTNMVSQLLRQHPAVSRRIQEVPMAGLCISVITEAELRFGLARRPRAHRLHEAVNAFLRRVDTLPWDRATAARYGVVRAALVARGRTVAPLDLLIASQALAIGAVLVSNDSSFGLVDDLSLEDWTR